MARVLILHTGGTLGMRPREPDRALAPDEIGATILENVPELSELAEIETRVLCNLDSTDMGPDEWLTIARAIADEIDAWDGFVVTHGTDTMAYTASALSFLLRGLRKPVILTGSQRPLADARSDGRANLVGAVDLAKRKIPEVCIYFDDVLLRGNRATKSSTFAYAAFSSPNAAPLAQLGTSFRQLADFLEPAGPFRCEGAFDPRVACARVIPGGVAAPWQALASTDLRGLVVEALGSGILPSVDRSVADALRALVERGVVVAVTSQSRHGIVNLGQYVGGRLAEELGAFGTRDMTVEASVVKLMYLLGSGVPAEGIEAAMRTPIAGEVLDGDEAP